MLKCDLHGLRFKDAKFKIIQTLRKCFNLGEKLVLIIHGYHGHILKDYVESLEFLNDMEEEGLNISKITSSTKLRKNPGESIFKIAPQKPYQKQKQIKTQKTSRNIVKFLQGGKKINVIDLQALFL